MDDDNNKLIKGRKEDIKSYISFWIGNTIESAGDLDYALKSGRGLTTKYHLFHSDFWKLFTSTYLFISDKEDNIIIKGIQAHLMDYEFNEEEDVSWTLLQDFHKYLMILKNAEIYDIGIKQEEF